MALAWLNSDPLGHLLLLRKLLQPLCQLLSDYITKAGVNWEQQQRRHEATAIVSEPEKVPRQVPLLDYVKLVEESKFQDSLVRLHDPEGWRHLPEHVLDVSFQTLCFRTISRAGCLAEELLIEATRHFPLRLFLVLETPSLYLCQHLP